MPFFSSFFADFINLTACSYLDDFSTLFSLPLPEKSKLPEPADGPATVMELRVAGEDGPSLTGVADEATGGAVAAPGPAKKSNKKTKKTTWRDGTVKTIVTGKFAFITPDTDPDGKGDVYVDVHLSVEGKTVRCGNYLASTFEVIA